MILVLRSDGRVVLDQPQDFTRLHLEIDPAFGTVEAAQARLGPLADIESRDVAWVARDALFDLGRAAAPAPGEPADWTASANAMLAKAARHGWVREQAPAIKSHIVWRA